MSQDWRNLDPVPENEQPAFADNWTPSQTFLRTMDACDRAALLHLKYRGGASSHALNRGSIVHEAIERLLRMLVAARRDDAEGIDNRAAAEYDLTASERVEQLGDQLANKIPPELGRTTLYEVMADNPELQISAEERDSARFLLHHFCEGTTWEPEKIIGIEKTLSLETGGFRVQGRPDLILDLGGGVCEIKDFKTAHPPDSEDFRAQAFDAHGNPRFAGNYQLCFLSILAAFGITDDGLPLGNFDRFRLSLEYPRILRGDEIDKRVVEVDRLQVQSFRDDLDLQLRRLREVCIGKRKWQATEGTHCRECPAEVACPLPRVLRPESQLANLDSIADLEKAATTWNFMSASSQRLKARLKKAAESFPDADLTLGTDENGEPILGVRIGKDLALVFSPTEVEKIADKENLRAAAEAAAKLGEPFNWEDHVKRSKGVEFKKKKLPGRNGK